MIQTPDFETVYQLDPDPYRVSSTFYEQRKQTVVASVLARPRYVAAWDPACGTGHLAAVLADRCDTVLATDLAGRAIEIARATCAGHDNVTLLRHALPAPPPQPVTPDLVVLAEFLYYLDDPDRSATLDLVDQVAAGSAEVVAVHWRHRPHDAYASGAEVQAAVVQRLVRSGWRVGTHVDDDDFVIDTLVRGPREH